MDVRLCCVHKNRFRFQVYITLLFLIGPKLSCFPTCVHIINSTTDTPLPLHLGCLDLLHKDGM